MFPAKVKLIPKKVKVTNMCENLFFKQWFNHIEGVLTSAAYSFPAINSCHPTQKELINLLLDTDLFILFKIFTELGAEKNLTEDLVESVLRKFSENIQDSWEHISFPVNYCWVLGCPTINQIWVVYKNIDLFIINIDAQISTVKYKNDSILQCSTPLSDIEGIVIGSSNEKLTALAAKNLVYSQEEQKQAVVIRFNS